MDSKVIVLDIAGGKTGDYIKSACKTDISLSDSTDIPSDCSCVIVSDEFLGENASELITTLNCTGVPICAATFDSSLSKQEQLSLTGVDDVFILPMFGALIDKKIELLTDTEKTEDLSFIEQLSADTQGQGSFTVNENDFKRLYEFIQRMVERLDKDASLVVFSFTTRFSAKIEPEIVNDFTSVVQRCLRRGDISCKSGHSIYVILVGADRSSSEKVAKRLIETFWSICDDDAYDIEYKVKPINS